MKKKAMALLPLLLIALSVVGFAYATWSDYVQIEGTAEMGEFLVGILDDSVTLTETGEKDKPWVASATYSLDKPETSVHHEPPETVWHEMVITIDNAFPCYDVEILFNLKNAGTIPAHIKTGTIIGEKRDKTGVKIYDLLWYDPDGDGIGSLWEDVNSNGRVDEGDKEVINLTFQKEVEPGKWEWPVCNQIDPCNCEWVKLILHFKEDAEECHVYWFKIHIVAVQWNMA